MARTALEEVLTRHQVFVQRLSAAQVGKFDPFLRRIEAEVRKLLAQSELTAFSRKRLETLLESVAERVGVPLTDFRRSLMSDLTEFWQHEAAFSARALADSAPGFDPVIPAPAQLRAAVLSAPLSVTAPGGESLLADLIGGWTAAQRKAVVGAIRTGVFQGQTNLQIVRRILGTAAAKQQDGLLAITRRQAAAVVNTAVQHASTAARAETFAENDDIVIGVRWISTLDSRTCERCAALDRQRFALDKGPRPPLHVNCRCTTIAVLKAPFDRFDEGGTRASAGSTGGRQVKAGLTYFDWLKDQPAGFQDAALGPSRAKLLREGGLSATRFAQLQLDRNFAPMTLEQMKRLEPLAFERAGL